MKNVRSWVLVVLSALSFSNPDAFCSSPTLTIRPLFDDSQQSQRRLFPYRTVQRPRVALVLSGGGARGVAQIGVIRVLERHNIPIDLIAATSLGAVVGGLYASGYTPDELEQLALTTSWDDVLSLSDDTRRTDLFIDQKIADDKSFVAIRFQGLEPVIPAAVSTGQRLTDFLSTKTLQALYHPGPSFDDLKISFRAVSTDLISGRRVILKSGSLAEALRASATVPLLFNPVEKNDMQLIDGGLVSNIPVDIALAERADLIIAVNSTSGFRNATELKAPWQAADQIMGIMMQLSNRQQLENADVVIEPEVGRHLSSDFSRLDFLIAAGERAAEAQVKEIKRLLDNKLTAMYEQGDGDGWAYRAKAAGHDVFPGTGPVEITTRGLPDSIAIALSSRVYENDIRPGAIRRTVSDVFMLGGFADVYAEVAYDSTGVRIHYVAVPAPRLSRVEFAGCSLIPAATLEREVTARIGNTLNGERVNDALEHVLRRYRALGYSLARIDDVAFNERTGNLLVTVNEGVIRKIDIQGGVRTQDYFVLREFPLEEGDVFEIGKANTGLTNINSTKLFDYVYLEVVYPGNQPELTIRLKERPTQLVRLGMRADSERNFQGYIDIRDENFHGTGAQLGLTASGGGRNREFLLEYRALRMFDSYFTFNIGGYHTVFDSYLYDDAPAISETRWDRIRVGEYRDVRWGGRIVVGSQLERFGNATIGYSLENVRIRNLENAEHLEEKLTLALLRIGTVIDSKDSYPFPQSGMGMNLSYEIASRRLGSDVGYNAFSMMYEIFTSMGESHTLHPRFTLGVADRTMPLPQQYRLGGRESFYGVHEDDRRGRQLFLFNLEYRYRLPMRLLFDTYARIRYDLGSISSVPEELKFSQLRHGIGVELALDSPVGPVAIGIGQGFNFVRDLPNNPIQYGPVVFYFLIGYPM